jgi:hypothetical protein
VVTYLSVNVLQGETITCQIILLGENNSYAFENGTIVLCYGPLNEIAGDDATIGLNQGDGEYAVIGAPTTHDNGIIWESHLAEIQNRNFIFRWDAQSGQYSVKEILNDHLLFFGDVSGDSNITAFDAALILQVVVGILQLNDPSYPYLTLERADVTVDGTVSGLDAALVLQYGVGLITELPQASTGAPALNAVHPPVYGGKEGGEEAKRLSEAIKRLESAPLSREERKVLESLKILVVTPLLPPSTALGQNFPNPFNPETWIPYDLGSAAWVHLWLFDLKGTLVRHLNLGMRTAGSYRGKNTAAYWDGRNSEGERVASGIYFYTLRAGNFTQTRKMVLLK